jgi:hypothetical protein
MTRITTAVNIHGERVEVGYQTFPSKTYRWAYVCVHPANGGTGGARYFKRKKDAEGCRRAAPRVPAIVGDVWNLN